MAYNEEKNISRLLEALLNQKLSRVKISHIFVIASGCTDRTEEIVREYIKKDNRIRLISQKKREGKSSAINFFIKEARENILVLESGDTLPVENTIENLILPFSEPEVGMTGAHVIPLNKDNTPVGFAVQTLWRLHHLIALKIPKMGELVAFRKIFQMIPKTSAVDEANIEPLVKGQGYRLVYVPEAIVYNRGPENVREFIRQRKRINIGLLALKENQGYMVATMSGRRVFLTLMRNFKFSVKSLAYTPIVIGLEVWARILAAYAYHYKKDSQTVWEICPSTKKLNHD
ncbi:MAG: glycosyltransferase [Patescibacteria group bacterium]